VVLALDRATDAAAEAMRDSCVTILRNGQSRDGGWGPYVTSAPQVFDTAMAVQALALLDRPGLEDAVDRGKAYLVSRQHADGSWPETTRPADQESYAQRISTTGWALLALLR
jgi:prenyltransferase beta subunit